MKRVVAAQGRAVVVDVPEPTLRPGELLVAPVYSVISKGTEMHIIHSTGEPASPSDEHDPGPGYYPQPKLRDSGVRWDGPSPRPRLPGTDSLGYSLAGQVVAVSPEITDLKVGDHVACGGNQGAFHAQRVAVPRNLIVPVPQGVTLDQAAFVTLGSISMHALRRTGCQVGETVVVYGLGLLGLLAVQIARAAGMYVVGLDIDDQRVELARELGAQLAVNPQGQDPVAAVLEMTDGFGADGVLLCVVTPSGEPLNLSFDMCRQRGCVVGVGVFGMEIDRERMYTRDVTFYPCLAYGPGRYDAVFEEGNVDYPIGYARWTERRNMRSFLRLVAEGKIDVSPLAPIRVPIDDAPRAYDLLAEPEHPPTVLLTYDAAE
jgi:threonine dehydrogenase-like Zn-dependent dehydrogenase